MFKALLIITFLFINNADACTPRFKECNSDKNHFVYDYKIKDIKTTLSPSVISIKEQDGMVVIKNLTNIPIYGIEADPKGKIILDGKNWMLKTERYLRKEKFSCYPESDLENITLINLEQVKWKCEQIDTSCGPKDNYNQIELTSRDFSFPHTADDFLAVPVLPANPQGTHTSYYLYKKKIHSITAKGVMRINPNYLKVTCDKGTTIKECGYDCWEIKYEGFRKVEPDDLSVSGEVKLNSKGNGKDYVLSYEGHTSKGWDQSSFEKKLNQSLNKQLNETNLAPNFEKAFLAEMFAETWRDFSSSNIMIRFRTK